MSANDLREVSFREEAQRRSRPVVEIGRLSDELLSRRIDKANVHEGSDDGVTQVLGRQALELVIEGQGVHEDRSRHVAGIGWHASIRRVVDFLSE